MYAISAENIAIVKTIFKAVSYESRAALCRSGGSVTTSFADSRILLIIWGESNETGCGMPKLGNTSFASGPWILFRSSLSRTDWKIAEEMATPPTCAKRCQSSSDIRLDTRTWPIPLKSCPKPVPTAMADSKSGPALSCRRILGGGTTRLTGYMGQECDLENSYSGNRQCLKVTHLA